MPPSPQPSALSSDVVDEEVSITFGSYTEKGRFRVGPDGSKTLLYQDVPVWVVTLTADAEAGSPARHIVVDAATGRLLTEFRQGGTDDPDDVLALHDPLDEPMLDVETAMALAMADAGLTEREQVPAGVTYGARYRSIPVFLQVVDVWKVTLDTSAGKRTTLVNARPEREVSRVVLIDDKAGHVMLSTAITAPAAQGEG